MLHSDLSPAEAVRSGSRKPRLLTVAVAIALLLSTGCADTPLPTDPDSFAADIHPAFAEAAGATRISGIGYYAEPNQCEHAEGQGSDFALLMTGDLVGCMYVFVEAAECTPGGAYVETGTETFVGLFRGAPGTFRTTYRFTAMYRDCENLAGQVAGRCQHPIVAGSGQGAFEGMTGRIDMTDDVQAGNFQYRGHLRS